MQTLGAAIDPRLERLTARRLLKAAMVGALVFGGLGTVAALWDNPLFIRMTPAGYGEVGLLVMLALLSGAYVAIRRPLCSNATVGTGGVLGFLGIACPVCNKILLFLFGGDLLLVYFEPVRLYVAAAGVLLAAWAVIGEWRRSADPEPMVDSLAGRLRQSALAGGQYTNFRIYFK